MTRKKTRSYTNEFRIIGGQWRGRRLEFPDVAGLRPTPDRVRETVFNWLQPVVVGARCLDLCAGSGAMGLEALSRGAACLTAVDLSAKAVRYLKQHQATLHIEAMDCHVWDAQTALASLQGPYDLIFLDPPYASDVLDVALEYLYQQPNMLAPGGWVYAESDQSFQLRQPWRELKNLQAGQVCSRILTK